jgi:hypothetical protein
MNEKRLAKVAVLGMLPVAVFLVASKPAETKPPLPRDERVLAMCIYPRLIPPPTSQDIYDAVSLTYDAGARGAIVHYNWNALEPAPGKYTLEKAADELNYLGITRGFEIQFTVAVVDTASRQMPPDLGNLPYNSPEVKQRFRKLLDALKPHLNRHVKYFAVGNELDTYFGEHPDEWSIYQDFYEDALAYLHANFPWMKVGAGVTFDGTTGRRAAEVAALNAASDVYVMTYYPVNGEFVAREPAAPLMDFPKMIANTKGKPVVLREVGFPTSPILNGSEEKQAEFIGHVFEAWDAAKGRIPFLSYFALHDLSEQICTNMLGYYNAPPSAIKMKEFLCSLGLRKADGTPKLGWKAFVEAAKTKGFPR